MPKIFICYRRKDASKSASRLHEKLRRSFGSQYIFFDRSSIDPGTPYPKYIRDAINSSTTFLVVIGRDWLTISKNGKRLLDYDDDIVRWEIATALERADKGEDIRVIPVLVDGASCPDEEDLPEVLKSLVERHCIEISPENWKKDIKPLLELIEEDFEEDFPRTFFGGAIAGLFAGVVVGCLYDYKQKPSLWGLRILIGAFYGLFAGVILSYFINSGITWRSRLVSKTKYSKIIDGTAGGALGGILAGIAGGLLFNKLQLGGGKLSSVYLMLAVAFSSMFLALGILFPEIKEAWRKRKLKGTWHKIFLIIIIVMCVTFVAALITTGGLTLLRDVAVDDVLAFYINVLILGSICGMMSGFQVGSTLFFYDRLKDKLGK
jgi:TIR domain